MAAFTAATFVPISAQANSSAPRHWTYTTADTKANMVASGYFDNAVIMGLAKLDIIHAVGSTGGTETLTTIFVDAVSAAGVVTTLSTVQILA